jgi:hypothetical protein
MHRSPPGRPDARTYSPSTATTPPTPPDLDVRAACGMMSPVPSENRPIQTPALFTPANACAHLTPPSYLRRESLDVPPSGALVRMCKGSGVTVYKMERSPARCGAPRSPWVIKKADISPLIAHELRRVERTLEHESCLLSRIFHPNIVGFRAAQVSRGATGSRPRAVRPRACACCSLCAPTPTCGPLPVPPRPTLTRSPSRPCPLSALRTASSAWPSRRATAPCTASSRSASSLGSR